MHGKSSPVQAKEPYCNSEWLLVGLLGIRRVEIKKNKKRKKKTGMHSQCHGIGIANPHAFC